MNNKQLEKENFENLMERLLVKYPGCKFFVTRDPREFKDFITIKNESRFFDPFNELGGMNFSDNYSFKIIEKSEGLETGEIVDDYSSPSKFVRKIVSECSFDEKVNQFIVTEKKNIRFVRDDYEFSSEKLVYVLEVE